MPTPFESPKPKQSATQRTALSHGLFLAKVPHLTQDNPPPHPQPKQLETTKRGLKTEELTPLELERRHAGKLVTPLPTPQTQDARWRQGKPGKTFTHPPRIPTHTTAISITHGRNTPPQNSGAGKGLKPQPQTHSGTGLTTHLEKSGAGYGIKPKCTCTHRLKTGRGKALTPDYYTVLNHGSSTRPQKYITTTPHFKTASYGPGAGVTS